MGLCFIDGNEAIVQAAVYAGCRFFAGYPITPASTILQGMIKFLPPIGGIVVQGEDEIGSIGYCLGASMAGLKAMTATSGPGISLYSENISFAIAGEIPLVIVDVMRLGPSTGSATRGADGDVQFLRWCHSGGLPVIVLVPTDVVDCFQLTVDAFNLAEEFRCPVFLASNKEIGMTRESVDPSRFHYPLIVSRRRHLSGPFRPFAAAIPDGVPPFLPLGGAIPVRQTSSTHGENGYITTDPEAIDVGVRRLKEKIVAQAERTVRCDWDRDPKARDLLITYGVTARAARETVKSLRSRGLHLSHLVLKTLWPVPEALLMDAARGMNRVFVVEMNLGQYVREIRRVLRSHDVFFFGRMNGSLIRPLEIMEFVRDELSS